MENENQPLRRTCGAAEVHQRLLQSPEYQQRCIQIEDHTNRFLLFSGDTRRSGVTKIAVVVHVVYSNASRNINDAQIASQIAVLNEDYRARNPDSAKVPAVWKNLRSEEHTSELPVTDVSRMPSSA